MSRQRCRRRSQQGGKDSPPQRREANAGEAFEGEQVARQDNRGNDRYVSVRRAHDAVLVHAQRHRGDQSA